MDDVRMFPIQGETINRTRIPYGQVPWPVAEKAYEVYSSRYGKDQSLQTLADRGGFGWSELVWLLGGGKKEDRCELVVSKEAVEKKS